MERFALKIGEMSIIGLLMVGGVLFSIFAFFFASDWDYLTQKSSPEAYVIDLVELVNEFPISEKTIAKVVAGEKVPTQVMRFDPVTGINLGRNTFSDDLTAEAKRKGVRDDQLKGLRFAIFADVPRERIKALADPLLAVEGYWSNVDVYVGGTLRARYGSRSVGMSTTVAFDESPTVRVVWLFTNAFDHKLAALGGSTPLVVVSTQDFSRTRTRNIMQLNAPKLIVGIAFSIFGLLAVVLALSGRGYLDVWAFAAFCMSYGMKVWLETPVFYENMALSSGFRLGVVFTACHVFSAIVMCLAFFRFDGRDLKVRQLGDGREVVSAFGRFFFVMTTLVGLAVSVVVYWTFRSEVDLRTSSAGKYALKYVAVAGLATVIFAGMVSLSRLRLKFQREDRRAQHSLMGRRILIASLFSLCVMTLVFVNVVTGQVGTEGSGDNAVMLATILPAFAMLLMFASMSATATRFYARFSPRLGQIDHEVMAFGEDALQRRYTGFLFVFDVAGMKRLNEYRSTGGQAERAVDSLLSNIEEDLGRLVQTGRTTFRYKSNGDEFIFAMWTKDLHEAKVQFADVMRAWRQKSQDLMSQWRAAFLAKADLKVGPKLAADFDLHVLACTMHEAKVTVKGGIETPAASPDFFEPRFTRLSALFKASNWRQVAVFSDDAELMSKAEGAFVLEGNGMGYWCFESPVEKDQGEPYLRVI